MSQSGRQVGLLYHPLVERSQRLAQALVPVVEACGGRAWVESAWAREDIVARLKGCELLVSMGGDGTILRIARAALGVEPEAQEGETPPILTINFGRLGFLAEVEPEGAAAALTRTLAGEYWIEPRYLLKAEVERAGEIRHRHLALNDVVLARADGPHALRLTVAVDGDDSLDYTADGIIVATPTGSTAYALGAGGPIMAPGVRALVVVPVAPHLTVARALVLPAESRVTLRATTRRQAVVAIDGQRDLPYETDDLVHVTHSRAMARFVRLGPRSYFYATLQDRLRERRGTEERDA